MERIEHKDFDFFMLQLKNAYAEEAEREKKEAEWRSLYGFMIWIPACFSLADQELTEEMLWSEERPDVHFSAEGNKAGVTVQIPEREIKSGEEIKNCLEKLDNRIVCYEMGKMEGSVNVHWIEYKSFAGDERVYNLLFFSQTGNRNILGTFYCLFEEYDKWKPLVWEMMRSIRENSDERI